MTPGARLQTAIDLLGAIETDAWPADAVVQAHMRRNRYIGSKDRRAITDAVFAAVRNRIRLDWLIARHGAAPTPRLRALAQAALESGADAVAALCDGGRFAPAPLDAAEGQMLAALAAARDVDRAAMPRAVRAAIPDWLEPSLAARFGDAFEAEAAALETEAPLDLRVDERRSGRDAVLAALASFGFDAAPTPLSPVGIRLTGRPPVTRHPAWRDGLIEIQDEGAQIVALLVGADSARAVVDFCAGAGGKTLAVAARLAEGARLVACDSDSRRLARMAPRLARAGVEGIETVILAETPDTDPASRDWLAVNAGAFDRVLLDVPCSGTGTWRRNPDLKRRLTPEALAGYRAQQAAILRAAAPLTAPGGRLIYVTCSLLAEENEDQVTAFLAAEPEFRTLDIARVWAETIGGACPASGPWLQLTPHRHGVDGFFVSVMERSS